jgi:hypothetical protein
MMKIKITYHISKIFCDTVLYGIISYGAAKLSWWGSQKEGEHVCTHFLKYENVMVMILCVLYYGTVLIFYNEDKQKRIYFF